MINRTDLISIVESFEFKHPLMEMRLKILEDNPNRELINLELTLNSRNVHAPGSPIAIIKTFFIYYSEFINGPDERIRQNIIHNIELEAQGLWLHEFREWLKINGKYVTEAHPHDV